MKILARQVLKIFEGAVQLRHVSKGATQARHCQVLKIPKITLERLKTPTLGGFIQKPRF
jgi:hypothetical protein